MKMVAGTVQNSAKMAQMTQKWEQKKEGLSKAEKKKKAQLWESMSVKERQAEHYKEQMKRTREGNERSAIAAKVQSGGELTAEEIEYLKEHDPQAYQDYVAAKQEKEAYERELKNCRTKEETDRLKMNKLGNFMAQAKSIASNPHIPKEKKVELMQKLNGRVSDLQKAHMKFVQSQAYENLPSEEEAKEQEEARLEALAPDTEAPDHTEEVPQENLPVLQGEASTDAKEAVQEDLEPVPVTFEDVQDAVQGYLDPEKAKHSWSV